MLAGAALSGLSPTPGHATRCTEALGILIVPREAPGRRDRQQGTNSIGRLSRFRVAIQTPPTPIDSRRFGPGLMPLRDLG